MPFSFSAGANVAVQFGAVPPKAICVAEFNKMALEDDATTEVVQLKTLSISVIVKLTTWFVSSRFD